MISLEYWHQGIGSQVLSLIHEDNKPIFFVSSKSYLISISFFQKQQAMVLVR